MRPADPTPESPPRHPVLGLRETVVFPRAVATLVARREADARAAVAVDGDERLLVVPETGPRGGPSAVGCLVRVLERTTLPDGALRLTVQGLQRARVRDLRTDEGLRTACAEALPEPPADGEEVAGRVTQVLAYARVLARLHEDGVPPDLVHLLEANHSAPGRLADLLAAHLDLSQADRARLLGEVDVTARLAHLAELMKTALIRAEVGHGLDEEYRARVRRGYLREQLESIRAELDEEDPHQTEALALEERAARTPLSDEVRRLVDRQLEQFRRVSSGSDEAGQLREHLEWVLDLPFEGCAGSREDRDELPRVTGELDAALTGRKDVKRRVLEYLAVRQLRGVATGTVLCFLGPPGTGKTSMGHAVAQALGRPIVEVPVGGLADEEELTGISHRGDDGRPGLLLTAVAHAGVRDPVILIDEIDKVAFAESGSAGGALLRVLDGERNGSFRDRYLGASFDLSHCLFLVTANDVEEIPDALLDRLEIVEFGSYSEEEKLEIVRAHILPRAREHAGLAPGQLRISPGARRAIVRSYTEEAGVRHLRRILDSLARKAAVDVVHGGEGLSVLKADLFELLGPATADEDLRQRRPRIGAATGLAWTNAGGSLLPIEVLGVPGSGRTIVTGQVGEVLRESMRAAQSYVRCCADKLDIDLEVLDEVDVHLHLPSAGTPKDGPSAGVAVAAALVSLLTETPAHHDVALTGELSLHGAVLPVGGIREKMLAALRAGMRVAVVPRRNAEDVLRLPPEVRAGLEIHLVDHVREVLEIALRQRGRGSSAPAPGSAGQARAARRARRRSR